MIFIVCPMTSSRVKPQMESQASFTSSTGKGDLPEKKTAGR